MTTRRSVRLSLLAAFVATPFLGGCDIDKHDTATGLTKTKGLTPNESGPGGSGSISDKKVNAGGPGAPGTTTLNPEK